MRVIIIVLLSTALGLVGCAVSPRDPQPGPAPTRDATGTLNSPAVQELSRSAGQAMEVQRFDQAARLLERAIAIEPRNPALWHKLARVRFEQGNLSQAGQLAARSNALLDSGSALKVGNDRLIEAARQAGAF